MKILITTDCYVYNMGGITASVLALCKGLRYYGHEVKVLGSSNKHKSFKDGDNYFIKSFPAFYYPDMRISFAKRDPLIRELEEWKPDIIHVQTEGTALRFAKVIMKHCKIPIVMTCHTDYGHFLFGKRKNSPPVKALASFIGGILYKKASKVVAPSQKASEFPFLRKVKDRVVVIPNGMELEKYRKQFSDEERHEFRMSMGIDDNTVVLVSVSRISKEKNIREIISFLPKLQEKFKDVKLLVVGDGPDKEYLEKMTKELNLNDSIIFTGRIPSKDVWQYYAAGDVFVSGSTFEVHSMSYLEALADGLPLLCREDEALKGVLEHGENGFIYHTEEEYLDYAYKLLSNDELRHGMANCSYNKAEEFSSESFASSALKVYDEVINNK
ncbi:MAG: glycosyltransferase [Clostridia bacterium]|nr:glycosyltransferase [Clostridia bacterium]